MPLKGSPRPRQVNLGSQEQGLLCGIASDQKPACACLCLAVPLCSPDLGAQERGEWRGPGPSVPVGLSIGPGSLLFLGDHVGLEETFNIHECDLHLKGMP